MKGAISISRPSRSSGVETIDIEIRDESSRTRFLEIEMGLADLARALTGLGDVPIRFELHRPDLVGSTAENKTELIVVPREILFARGEYLFAKEEALKPFTRDGWYPRDGVGSFENPHYYLDAKEASKAGITVSPDERAVRVVFFRHIRPDGTPVQPRSS